MRQSLCTGNNFGAFHFFPSASLSPAILFSFFIRMLR